MKIRSIPTPIALAIIMIGLIGSIFLVRQASYLGISASSNVSPQQVRITNISDFSFVVSWITGVKTTGAVSLEMLDGSKSMAVDIRDQSQQIKGEYLTHYVLVKNLEAEKKYLFRILSGGKTFLNSDKPFEVTTAPARTPIEPDMAQGKILTSANTPANGAIVYLSLPNAIVQSALSDTNGNWIIPLSVSRNSDLTKFSGYDREAQVEEIFVVGDGETASATVATSSDNPVPDIVLGQNYNFLSQMPNAPSTPTPKIQTSGFENSNLSLQGEDGGKELTITFPSEKEAINSGRPEFFGTGPKGKKIEIIVESENKISGQTVIDTKGDWKWNNQTPLSPGEHTITVSYADTEGFVKKVSRTFVVLAAGESDLPSFTATSSGQTVTPSPARVTPSLTLSPSVMPTIPTVSQTPIGSITPTKTLTTPTPTPLFISASPSPIPTPIVRTTLPSTQSGVPTSGIDTPTKVFMGAGVVVIFLGVILLVIP